jgi:transposase
MRGKKGKKHSAPDDPPRRRANKLRGHGTWDTDRPPVLGVVGRETGLVQLWVAETVDAVTLQWFVGQAVNAVPEVQRLPVEKCSA